VGVGGRQAAVLLVEDEAELRAILHAVIVEAGHTCVPCGSAEEALERAGGGELDAAVIDVQLPAMDGIALAAQLKAARTGEPLFPVILISGGTTPADRVRGLTTSCDDFLEKPLDLAELRVRLDNQLARRAQVAALARANRQLRDVERKKRELAALVVHDLRSPLAGVIGSAELLGSALRSEAVDREQALQLVTQVDQLGRKALSLVASILDVEELEEGMLVPRLEEVWVETYLEELVRPYRPNVATRGLRLDLDLEPGLRARFDPGLVGRVIENLLDNAVRYAARRGRVVLWARTEEDALAIAVGNDGPPVDPADRDRLFDRYYRAEERRVSARENRGLGLYFCRLAAEAHRGSITVETAPDLPCQFVLRLPDAPSTPSADAG
jgi:signal transduction histidine kinase